MNHTVTGVGRVSPTKSRRWQAELGLTSLESPWGPAAVDLIGHLNVILHPVPEGEEYVVAMVGVTYFDDQKIDKRESLRIQGHCFRLDVESESEDELLELVLRLKNPGPDLPFALYLGQTFDVWVVFTIAQDAPTPALGFLGAGYDDLDWLTALPIWWELDPENAIRLQDLSV